MNNEHCIIGLPMNDLEGDVNLVMQMLENKMKEAYEQGYKYLRFGINHGCNRTTSYCIYGVKK